MKFLKNNMWTLCSFVIMFAMLAAGDASAQTMNTSGSSIMDAAAGKARNVFTSVKTITFILGGFGLIGIAYQAIIGKVKWAWFAGLAVGLALLAAAGAIVQYATGSSDANIESTFGQDSVG